MDLKKQSKQQDLVKSSKEDSISLPVHENLSSLNYTQDFDHKLVFDKERVTYTFLDEHQVVCLHYDKKRQELFFNGRRIVDLTFHERMFQFLCAFKKALLSDKIKPQFLRSFDLELSKIFETSHLEEAELTLQQPESKDDLK